MRSPWDDRIQRADELHEKYPFARQVLGFYRTVLIFQKELSTSLSSRVEGTLQLKRPSPPPQPSLRYHIASRPEGANPVTDAAWRRDGPLLLSFFPSFLALIQRVGTEELSAAAGRLLASSDKGLWERLLKGYWAGGLSAQDAREEPALLFFPKAFLQPYAEILATKQEPQPSDGDPAWHIRQEGLAFCPRCGRTPQLGILTAEGEGAGRTLVCSLCATGWRYKRVCCPACGEENFSRLSYSRASDFPHIRVDLCSSCRRYIKTIDLTADGRAVPTVDEIASLPLDLWAVEQGYAKIELNLVGL